VITKENSQLTIETWANNSIYFQTCTYIQLSY